MAQPEGRPVVAGEATRQGRPGQQQQQQGFGQTVAGIVRMAVFWYFAMKFFGPKKPAEPSQLMSNMLTKGEPLDMWVYLSENEKFKDFGKEDALVWHEANIPYAVWGPSSFRSISLKYYPSEVVKNNGSLYAHVFFARSGYPPDPNDPEYEPLSTFGRTHSIVTFLPKPKSGKKKSLIGSSKGSEEEESAFQAKDDKQVETNDESHVEWISYWKPNVTIDLVDDFTRYSHNQIPPHIAGYINVEPTTGNYYPTIFFNEFWLLRDKLIPLNDTVIELPLNLELGLISLTKWQFFLQIEQAFLAQRSYGSMLEGESDEVKRVFLEGNPYLLALTMIVSVLHSLFDILAFKNDIQFWNKNKSIEDIGRNNRLGERTCSFKKQEADQICGRSAPRFVALEPFPVAELEIGGQESILRSLTYPKPLNFTAAVAMERSSGSADYWRRFFRSCEADIFEVIEHAILVAASDYPDELRSKRDGIVEKFYTVLLPPCFDCDRVAPQGAEAEEGRGSVNSKADSCIVDLEFSNRGALSNCTDEAAALTAEMEEEDRTLEQVLWIKDILSDRQDQSDDVLLELLMKLQLMELTVDVLEKTKIGKAVNVLHKHNSKQIRHLSRSLIDGWKVIVDEWISATSAITGISDSLSPSAEDEEAGLPSPPLDEGALFAAPTSSMMLSGFFDGMDDDGNFRNNNLDEKWEIGRDPKENHGTVEKQSIVVGVETRRQLANSRGKLHVGGKRISIRQANSQNIVSKQTKPLVAESTHGRPAELTSEKQKCTEVKIKLPQDTAKLQKKPASILQNRSKCSEEELVQVKLEAAKRKLNEGYQQAENAKKQRTIQVMELQDLPKQAGNTLQPLHKFKNQSRNWPNGRRQ